MSQHPRLAVNVLRRQELFDFPRPRNAFGLGF